jgi:glycosyltransferase involved in cell wall biosynthesis
VTPPLVSVVLATRDAAATLGQAVRSVLQQTLRPLELVVVDDGSTDETPALLDAIADDRLVVLRNEAPLGLAASLNRGLEAAGARWVARLDADDVAHPERLERQLARMLGSGLGVLGTATVEVAASGAPGALHRMPGGPAGVRWRVLFGSPFFHPTTMLDRQLLDRHGLRYDTGFEQSQDYELWSRLLAVATGDNMQEALVVRRMHPRQVSKRRREGQRELQRQIAVRQMMEVAPGLSPEAAELAWLVGAGEPLPESAPEAVEAYLALHAAFCRLHDGAPDLGSVRVTAARAVMRAALAAEAGERAALLRRSLAVDPTLPLRGALDRARLARARDGARADAAAVLARLGAAEAGAPVRVTVVSPEPTPYRSPLFDRVAERPEVDLTVLYAADTVAGRTWQVQPEHRAVVLEGVRVPGVRRLLRHEYPVTPGVGAALDAARPEVVVVSGWSQFASQAAIAWCRRRRVPYLLLVSSHDAVARAAWRRAVRSPIVPRIVRGAWGAFALGALSRASLVANGARPDRVRLFANTVDVPAWIARAEELQGRRGRLREALGLREDDVAVLSVARLAPEKGLDTLVDAVAAADDARLVAVVAGDGDERDRLAARARASGVRLVLPGDVEWSALVEAYVAADVFALLSRWEPWGVVVNEAAACGLPLVLSDQVGAAADLLRDGVNGALVPAGDVEAAAAALRALAADPEARRVAGAASRDLVRGWGYEPSVASFVEAVLEAAGRDAAAPSSSVAS